MTDSVHRNARYQDTDFSHVPVPEVAPLTERIKLALNLAERAVSLKAQYEHLMEKRALYRKIQAVRYSDHMAVDLRTLLDDLMDVLDADAESHERDLRTFNYISGREPE